MQKRKNLMWNKDGEPKLGITFCFGAACALQTGIDASKDPKSSVIRVLLVSALLGSYIFSC